MWAESDRIKGMSAIDFGERILNKHAYFSTPFRHDASITTSVNPS
jgi:hypothetical protein